MCAIPLPTFSGRTVHGRFPLQDYNQTAVFLRAERRSQAVVRLPLQARAGRGAPDSAAGDAAAFTNNVDSGAYVGVGDERNGLLRYVDVFPELEVSLCMSSSTPRPAHVRFPR